MKISDFVSLLVFAESESALNQIVERAASDDELTNEDYSKIYTLAIDIAGKEERK